MDSIFLPSSVSSSILIDSQFYEKNDSIAKFEI